MILKVVGQRLTSKMRKAERWVVQELEALKEQTKAKVIAKWRLQPQGPS